MWRRKLSVFAVAGAVALSVSACGGDSGGGGGGGSATELTGRGPITLVQGKDTSGFVKDVLNEWNSDHPDEKVRLVELPADADSQRQQMIQNAQTRSDTYTVLDLDVVWTSEFAANRWVTPLPKDEFPLDDMLDATVATGLYRDELYAVPKTSDGGLLYYRTDLLEKAGIDGPPTTWEEMQADCEKILAMPEAKGMSCYAGQFDKYEGLTVNFAEAIESAGGTVTDAAGDPELDTPEAQRGLETLVGAFESGMIPREALTYTEEEGRQAFQAGDLVFHRQWPYQYALADARDGSSKVAGKFDVAPLPGIGSSEGHSSLGGHNLAISMYAKHKATALDFIKFFSSEQNQRQQLNLNSRAPTIESIYDDPALQKKFPFLSTLKESIGTAVPRPRVVDYGDATAAIQDGAYAAITGEMSSEEALQQMQEELSGMQ